MMVQPQLAMFSTPDMIIILVVALILFGPKNLPKMARGIGKSMEEFRRAAREIETEIMKEPEPTSTPPPPPPATTEGTPAAEHTPEGEHHYSETGEEYPGYETGNTTETAPSAPVVVSDNPVVLPADAAPASAAVTSAAPAPEAAPAVVPAAEPAPAASVNPPVEKKPDAQTAA
jgi:TatA/E family protein of Tat protein translocase